jgi:hypothetical protein
MESFRKILNPRIKQLKTISLRNYLSEDKTAKKFVSEERASKKEDA